MANQQGHAQVAAFYRWHKVIGCILLLCAGLGSAQDEATIEFYIGTKGQSIRALKDRNPPYIHLNDLLRSLGFAAGEITEDKVSLQLNRRLVVLDAKAQSVKYTGITRPMNIHIISGQHYIRVNDIIAVFSELLGRQMVYEPVSKSLHIPADETFSARLITRQIGKNQQLEIVYSRSTKQPKVERFSQQLIIKIYESPISIDRERLIFNQAVENMELFERLPDGSTEILFQLGSAVKAYDIETFRRRNPRTIIHFTGSFSSETTQTGEQIDLRPVGLQRIVIDPGHGGKDRGTIGPTGLKEKTVTLDLARRLERALKREGHYQVLLTRNGDSSLALKARTGMANNFNADLFISIHLNAVHTRNARGSETYYLSLEEDKDFDATHYNSEEAEEAAAFESETSELELILWDMAQAKHLEDSFRIAKYIQDELNNLAGIRSRGVKQAPMKVLKGAQMPAVLVEVAFLTDPVEERKLKGSSFREKIVRSMMNAILKYDREVQLRSKESAFDTKEGH